MSTSSDIEEQAVLDITTGPGLEGSSLDLVDVQKISTQQHIRLQPFDVVLVILSYVYLCGIDVKVPQIVALNILE